jgi:hypothetical protein
MDQQNEKCVMVIDESLPFTTSPRLSNKIMFPQITRRARCKICDMILLKLTMEISKSNFVDEIALSQKLFWYPLSYNQFVCFL